jgi:hypothetical protein
MNTETILTPLRELLIAAGLGSIQHDRVMPIEENEIHTAWSSRGCAQTGEYELPYSIVDESDPISTAVTWARTQAITKALGHIDKTQLDLRHTQEAHAKACALPT